MEWKRSLPTLFGLVLAGLAANSHAADWIMMLGTEPPNAKPRFFGAAAVTYSNYLGCDRLSGLAKPDGTADGDPNAGPGLNNGLYVNKCRVGPELRHENEGTNLDALVLGSRGPITDKINYFMTAQLGANAATYKPLNTKRERIGSLTDASVTLNHIPGARLRLGLFKKPGPEELMQPLKRRDYIYLTDYTRRDQVERFVTGNAKGTKPIPDQGEPVKEAYDADMGRDWGIQVFDAFRTGKWKHTYAAMLANGNGIHQSDNNNDKDLNLYWASQYDLPGGKGPYKHGVKLYAYHQKGVRNFIKADGSESEDFDRVRYGIGVKALGRFGGYKQRFGLHRMYADGMVLQSAVNSCTDCPYGGQMQFAAEDGNKAMGTTVDYGFYLNKEWQFDLRWSRNNLLYETADNTVWSDSDERIITEFAVGTNYHFSPKTRLTLNYVFRESEAPNDAEHPNPNVAAVKTRNADRATSTVGDVVGLRIMHFF